MRSIRWPGVYGRTVLYCERLIGRASCVGLIRPRKSVRVPRVDRRTLPCCSQVPEHTDVGTAITLHVFRTYYCIDIYDSYATTDGNQWCMDACVSALSQCKRFITYFDTSETYEEWTEGLCGNATSSCQDQAMSVLLEACTEVYYMHE
jgi:hypothetical protein